MQRSVAFWQLTECVWLLPGDLARWLPDGNIEFLGRIDFQVQSLRMSCTAFLFRLSLHAMPKRQSCLSILVGIGYLAQQLEQKQTALSDAWKR